LPDEVKISYTLPIVQGGIGNSDMSILIFQRVGGQVVVEFLLPAGKRQEVMIRGEVLERYVR